MADSRRDGHGSRGSGDYIGTTSTWTRAIDRGIDGAGYVAPVSARALSSHQIDAHAFTGPGRARSTRRALCIAALGFIRPLEMGNGTFRARIGIKESSRRVSLRSLISRGDGLKKDEGAADREIEGASRYPHGVMVHSSSARRLHLNSSTVRPVLLERSSHSRAQVFFPSQSRFWVGTGAPRDRRVSADCATLFRVSTPCPRRIGVGCISFLSPRTFPPVD
ncbi:hypothetical protein K438DRAFT_1116514 [Mycena galopus ATCC 62051]|nr:hypothetical protein K438DRAFT_1116514 [Mycena galopus ATCC 62051]